jgi:hypothetical protein
MGCAAVPSKLMTSCHRLRGDLPLAHNGLGDLLARRLTIAGDSVVRIENAWSKDRAKKIFYAHNPAVPQLSTEEA